jgi:hypothetical protein
MFPLAATLDLIAPVLPTELVPPESYVRLHAAAGRLPAALTHWVFLECHLTAPQARTDITFSVDVSDAVVLGTLDRWRRLAAFGRRWGDARSQWHEHIARVWLEFDLDGETEVGPSLFLELRTQESWDVVARATDRLSSAQASLLRRCVDELPSTARVLYVGLFSPRGSHAVRLCVVGIGDTEIPAYLERVAWPGDYDALAAELTACRAAHVAGVGVLDLDIGSSVRPEIGLEFMFRRETQARGRLCDAALLDRLVEHEWCRDAQRRAFETWPGSTHTIMPHELWESVLYRRLNHVKVTFAVDRIRDVKAYLSIGHAPRTRDSTP